MLDPRVSPLTLFRVARDRAFEQFGHLPAARIAQSGSCLSGIHLGLRYACNGSPAYVVYHRNFFDPRAYAGLGTERVAWLRLDEIARFNREVLPRVEGPFVLVTAESDWTAPSDFPAECATLMRSGKVRRWFANNYDHRAYGERVTALPIGVNYRFKHTLERAGPRFTDSYNRLDAPPASIQDARWEATVAAAPPLAARVPRAFGDFWVNDSSRSRRYGESRSDICATLRPGGCVVFPERRLALPDLVAAYARHAFVVSPHGGGLDCYRTWDALRCGCIVIVKRSPIDPLYAGLPVVILDDWREITPANLQLWLAHFGDGFDRTWLRKVLSLEHWRGEIDRAAETCFPPQN